MRIIALPGTCLGTEQRVLSGPPFGFRLAKWFQRYEVPGGYRFERLLRKAGYLDVLVRYPLSGRAFVDMPIGLGLRNYMAAEVAGYETASVRAAAHIVEAWGMPATLVDCGADVGLMSAKFVDACASISRVIAFEPNPRVYGYLHHNIECLPVDGKARCSAVADYHGRGSLACDAEDQSDHGAFLVPNEFLGSVDVVRIDELGLSTDGGVILKVDVEGGEFAVLRGAQETIAKAKRFLILFEAHPRHVQRTGTDPRDLIKFIQAIRPCRVQVSEYPDIELRLDKPLFEELGVCQILNVCAYTP